MTEPLVSICAVAYNHEKYIRECLDHFLDQETDFPFEILIHDDASTDSTQDIIREYAEKYPDIIKPMLETENQYSQGITNLSGAFNFPRARGKYIALCDCDDFWCSRDKLKRQTAYMESHPDCMMSVHCAKTVNENGEFINRNLMRPYRGDRLLKPEELVDKAGSFPFGSMLLRSELVRTLPDYYVNCPVGDRPLELMAAAKGNAWYFDTPMSVYRFNSAGSWTDSMKTGDYRKKQNDYAEKMREMYRGFDRETEGRFHREAVSASHRLYFLTQVNIRNWDVIFDQKYRRFYKELPVRDRFFISFEHRLPSLYGKMQKLSHRIFQ
jgi:glycosyltransferase involved in cell wall biosynthesis